MMRSIAAAFVLAVGCGGHGTTPSTTPTQAASSVTPPPTPAEPAPPVHEARAAITAILTEGPGSQDDVRARVEPALDAIGKCVTAAAAPAPTALELSFAMLAKGELPHVQTYGELPAELASCIGSALGETGTHAESDAEPTDVYVALAVEVDGHAPAPASPPTLHDDVDQMCSVLTLSGADQLSGMERVNTMKAWIAAHIRHPRLHHLGWTMWVTNPADRKDVMQRLQRDAGVTKRCDV